MQLTLADDLVFAILAGLIILAYALAKSVADRDPTTGRRAASFWIFFSSIWFIGPVTYFLLRNRRPLLARRCLQQLAVATIAFIAMGLISNSHYLRSIPGAIVPPEQSSVSTKP
jgi:hypothetical protein